MKKKLPLFVIILTFGIVALFSLSFKENELNYSHCPFCDPNIIENQKFYEDDLVIALYTHKPIFPGHSLIIPKRHVERFEMLLDEEIMQMGKVIKRVNQAAKKVFSSSSYLLLQKNGKESGETVPHVHFHYIPRQTGDKSSLKFIFKMYMANFSNPISSNEMQEIVTKMKKAMETEQAA